MGWYLGHKGLLAPPPPPSVPMLPLLCTFFKIFHLRLGIKGKFLVFIGVYVCVKARLTLFRFFPFFFAPFPNINIVIFHPTPLLFFSPDPNSCALATTILLLTHLVQIVSS